MKRVVKASGCIAYRHSKATATQQQTVPLTSLQALQTVIGAMIQQEQQIQALQHRAKD
jgi:hypothetical protein